jgi:ribosomal protein L11 methyltransferase
MDPGSAFGTGQHATTALCLRALDQIAASGGIGSLADIGCGTGILAIGADLLGAGPIWMVDNDPLALTVAGENLDNMGMRDRILMECQDEPSHPQRFNTVVANILAPVLIRLAVQLSACVEDQGRLLLSGLLYSQIDDVEAEYLALGWHRTALSCEGEWALLWLQR